MDSHRSLFSHKLSGAGNKFQPTCRANLNFVNKTKVDFQFAQFVTKQGAVTVLSMAVAQKHLCEVGRGDISLEMARKSVTSTPR